VLVLSLILLTVSSAGCIDIEWVRDNFIPPPSPTVVYIDNYVNVSYSFNTDPQNMDSLVYNNVFDVEVANGSLYVDVRINTQFDELPEEFPVNLSDLQERLDLDRNLKVTLFRPDNEVFHTETYDQTTYQLVQWDKVASPRNGTWHLEVEAEGLGSDIVGYHDNFNVQVIVRTPTLVMPE